MSAPQQATRWAFSESLFGFHLCSGGFHHKCTTLRLSVYTSNMPLRMLFPLSTLKKNSTGKNLAPELIMHEIIICFCCLGRWKMSVVCVVVQCSSTVKHSQCWEDVGACGPDHFPMWSDWSGLKRASDEFAPTLRAAHRYLGHMLVPHLSRLPKLRYSWHPDTNQYRVIQKKKTLEIQKKSIAHKILFIFYFSVV